MLTRKSKRKIKTGHSQCTESGIGVKKNGKKRKRRREQGGSEKEGKDQ